MNKKNNEVFYITLITITLIISNIFTEYSYFKILEYPVILSVFTYPFILFFANQLTKKSISKTIIAILIALLVQTLIFISTNLLTSTKIDLYIILATLISFGITMIINTIIYNKYLKNSIKYLKLLILYTGMLLMDSIIYLLINNNGIPLDFFMLILLSNIFRILIGALLALIEVILK